MHDIEKLIWASSQNAKYGNESKSLGFRSSNVTLPWSCLVSPDALGIYLYTSFLIERPFMFL